MSRMERSVLRSKFSGSMLGVLVGDCLGSPFEAEETLTAGMKLVLHRSLNKLEGPVYKAPVMQFTDDSAMTLCLAESLVEKKELDIVDVAKRFVRSYYKEPNRGYGPGVVTVFQKLRANKFADVTGPAREQFNGQGSWGNGSAMRIAPVALFSYANYEKMVEMSRETSRITHAHKAGIDGAILQAIAIRKSLLSDPNAELNTAEFIDDLIGKMTKLEVDEEGLGLEDPQPYKSQLDLMKSLIVAEDDGPHAERVVQKLGNSVAALYSVPTAIYCFLRAQRPIHGIETENPLRRAIQYAVKRICNRQSAIGMGREISLGGDTDTIGSMTGALAGAFYGEEKFSPNLFAHCERSSEFRNLGEKLFELATS